MHSGELLRHLRAKAREVASSSFGELEGRLKTREILDFGETSPPGHDYFQIEIEILDRYFEGEVEVLHIPVTARDISRTFSTDVFVSKDGKNRWNEDVYEFKNGVPVPLVSSLD